METIRDMQTVKPASQAADAAPPENREEEGRSAHMQPILGGCKNYVNLKI